MGLGYNWGEVETELREWHQSGAPLSEVSPLSLDTLWGSVRGLRWQGMAGMDISMEGALLSDKDRVLGYAYRRLGILQTQPNFAFTPRVPERCQVGCGTFGWKYDPDIVREAAERGSLIDTAEGYGYGRVEVQLGEALRGLPAEITTKVRRDHMSPSSLRNAVVRSREKLDRTPHYQLHYPHHQYPEAVLLLAQFRREGLIQSIGVGNCSVDQLESDQRLLSDRTGDVIRSVQVPFSLLEQRVRKTVIPYCRERGILVLAYSPLGQSFKAMNRPVLGQVANKYGSHPATVALAWVLSHPGVMPIPRTNDMDHLLQNWAAEDLELSEETVEELALEYQEEE